MSTSVDIKIAQLNLATPL